MLHSVFEVDGITYRRPREYGSVWQRKLIQLIDDHPEQTTCGCEEGRSVWIGAWRWKPDLPIPFEYRKVCEEE